MKAFKLLGISEETECECCGKANLKRTVVLAHLDADGNTVEVVKFGRDCAARALGIRVTANRMETLAIAAQEKADLATRNVIHTVGEVRSVANWIVESIDNNGGSFTFLAAANGLRSAVEPWARERFPNHEILVRKAI
jgi:hypothetical protein